MLHLVMEMLLGFGRSLWALGYNYFLSASVICWACQDLDNVLFGGRGREISVTSTSVFTQFNFKAVTTDLAWNTICTCITKYDTENLDISSLVFNSIQRVDLLIASP